MPFRPKTLTLTQYNTRSEDEDEDEDEDDDIDPPANLDTFLNSLFDPWPGPFAVNPGQLFRAGLVNLIKTEETDSGVSPICWLVDDATVTLLVDILEGYWNDRVVLVNPSPRIIESDRTFIRFVKKYIEDNDLRMRIPSFQCKTKRNNKPSTYEWVSDRVYSFKDEDNQWSSAVVRIFLQHLLAGAHFVVVHGANDLGNNMNLPSFFETFSRLPGTGRAGHSHYTAGIALRGVNYPELTLVTDEGELLDELEDRDDAVLLPVVLCDTTTKTFNHYNSFFQMEGWRPGRSMCGLRKPYNNGALVAGYRHGADFQTHKDTLWNISTYGASLFSEKRGAPIFLAPQSWMNKRTHVYAGFDGPNAGHAWFWPDLVTGLP